MNDDSTGKPMCNNIDATTQPPAPEMQTVFDGQSNTATCEALGLSTHQEDTPMSDAALLPQTLSHSAHSASAPTPPPLAAPEPRPRADVVAVPYAVQPNTIYNWDALTTARTMKACGFRVNCVVTSPPYFGLRDYGVDGQIGLEPSPAEYVAALVEVFHAIRDVLTDDGVLWLNLGDSYANDDKWGGSTGGRHVSSLQGNSGIGRQRKHTGLKSKDLIGIPWRVAFALQADGWYLRSDVIWSKPNPMPESVTDRPTKAHEYVFLLTKRPDYWYDADAIKEPATDGDLSYPRGSHGAKSNNRGLRLTGGGFSKAYVGAQLEHGGDSERKPYDTRNKRSVWSIPTEPSSIPHYAMMPSALAEVCIKAGCPETVCSECGAPHKRVTVKSRYPSSNRPQAIRAMELFNQSNLTDEHIDAMQSVGMADTGKALVTMSGAGKNTQETQRLADEAKTVLGGYYREFCFTGRETVGFAPTCTCNAGTRHGVVFDPFMGVDTTAFVARKLKRDYVGCEIDAKSIARANRRLRKPMTASESILLNANMAALPLFAAPSSEAARDR